MIKKCNYYIEVKSLKELESKIFKCDCKRHFGDEISVVNVEGVIRQVLLSEERS